MPAFLRASWVVPVVSLACLMTLGVSPVAVRGQNSADWFGGTGNWSEALNWNCVINGKPGHCVPNGASFAVDIQNGIITVNTNPTIGSLFGTGTLTLNGTSLTATQDVELSVGGLNLSGGASISVPNSAVETQTLTMQGSTITTLATYVSGATTASGVATITGSTLNTSLHLGGTLSLEDSTVVSSGPAAASALIYLNGPSSISGSTYNGMITIDQGGSLDISGDSTIGSNLLVVGNASTGTMNLNGGTVGITGFMGATGAAFMGVGPGSSGAVTVAGSGSQFNASSADLFVGSFGQGTLTVQQGATGSSQFLDIGRVAGGAGTVTLTDKGTTWTNGSGDLTVGDAGTGTLAIQNSGALSNSSNLIVGNQSGGNGTVTISGGGQVSNADATIAAGDGSTGQVTVTGSNSQWINSGKMTTGSSGDATLTISSGGVVSSPDATVADNKGSTGAVLVTGSGSQLNNTGDLVVGNGGSGTLQIMNGGKVASFTASIGDEDDSHNAGTGIVTVSDNGSVLSLTSTLTVGDHGTGTLNILNGALVESGDGTLAGEDGSQGAVSIKAGQWNSSGKLTIGDQGLGTLTATGGTITSDEGSIGSEKTASGKVELDANSQWTMAHSLSVGEEGAGSLIINGSKVSDLEATIGEKSTGNGLVTVGVGGVWTNTNDLTVGEEGKGVLNIQAGGVVKVLFGQGVDVGKNGGASGIVKVDGVWVIAPGLTIGSGGNGTLTIENGGSVASGDGSIAEMLGSKGTATVTGAGLAGLEGPSSWTVDGTLSVGEGGTGVLNVTSGGRVLSQAGFVGHLEGSQGTVTISDKGSQWAANLPGGSGIISVGEGGSQGALNVLNGGEVIATQVTVGTGGVLDGKGGTVAANVVNEGGTVDPASVGTMTINGNYMQDSGTLLFEIDGASSGQFGELAVSGTATISGGIFAIDFANGFIPQTGEDFNLLMAALGLSVSPGVAVDISGLPAGFQFADTFTTTGFDLKVTGTPGVTPEPGTLALLGTGLVGIGALGRRRRSAVSKD